MAARMMAVVCRAAFASFPLPADVLTVASDLASRK
jgi:hypothetical protein